MSDITLVNTVFPSEVKVPPQGILYLTSALEDAGFDVDIRDYQLCGLDDPWEPAALARFVERSAPVLGFSCMSYALPLVIEAARLIKQRHPSKVIVLGGIGPSGAGEALLGYCPEIDIIVTGEGERTIVDLMRCIRKRGDPKSVAGMICRDGRDSADHRAAAPDRLDDRDRAAGLSTHRPLALPVGRQPIWPGLSVQVQLLRYRALLGAAQYAPAHRTLRG